MNFTDYELLLILGCIECVLKAGMRIDKQHFDILKDLFLRIQEYFDEDDEVEINTSKLN